MGDNSEEHILWQAVLRADENASARIYEMHADLIYAFCLRRGASVPDAQDVVAETFLQLWRQAAFRAFAEESALETVSLAVSPYSYADIGEEIVRLAKKHPEVVMWSAAPNFSGVVATVPRDEKVRTFSDVRLPVELRLSDPKWVNFGHYSTT